MSEQLSREVSENLTFKSINIFRLDGIREGFEIEAFSPGINLIHGPNGIGKSRTAMALQSLIWPKLSSEKASLIGNVDMSDDTWNIELDLGKAAYQKNSVPVPNFSLAIPPESHQDRYLLTLQDLLRVENRNFALEILKEASGGYDLGHIHSELNIPTSQRGFRPSKPAKPLQMARERIHNLRQQETALRDQEASLKRLRDDHANAIAAAIRIGELESARAFQNACHELEAARLGLDSFPAALGKMLGDEYQRAESLNQRLGNLREEHRKSTIQISNLQEEIQSTGFSEEIPSNSVITSLRYRLEELQRQELEIRQVESKVGELSNQIAVLRSRWNRELSEKQMEKLDATGLRRLAELSREWQQVDNTLQIQNQLAQWLGESSEWDRESLRSGMELLSRHLRTQNADTTSCRRQLVIVFLIGAASIIILEAVLLATSFSQYSLLLALAALPLLWLAFTTKSDATETELQKIQSQYSALGLKEPMSWIPEEVHKSLMEIQKTAARAEIDNERAVRWGNLQNDRERASARRQAVRDKGESFTNSYGIDLAETVPESLVLLAKAVEDWRRESDQLLKAESQKQALESSRISTLFTINEELRSNGLDATIDDATSAQAAIELLADRTSAAHSASAALDHIRQRMEKDIAPQIGEIEHQLESMYGALGLEPDDVRGLKQLSDQVVTYKEAHNSVMNADVAVSIARSQLRPGNDDENLDHDAISLAMTIETELESRRDGLQAEISRIETEIDQARRQTRIEEEVAIENAARDVLIEGRSQDYASAADRLIFELVQNRNRELNRPHVFRIANDLFISFTNGAYRLGLDEGNSEFIALEAETGRSIMLDQLSSGTRVQLLLAVRLAFIEASEQGLQLPLILDETLGNTDDIRAKAIIETTIEIASRGRQVFYFTAQHDEIGKWSSALSDLKNPLDWLVLDLASIRAKRSIHPTTMYIWDHSAFVSLDLPDGADHESLFDLLSVPPIDIHTANVLEVDLWYVIPDVPALAELRNRGIQQWGQYLNLQSGGHLRGVWSESLHERALARAQVIEEFLGAWRVGRPEPLTVDHLNKFGQISIRFWDEVVACAQRYNWDARGLIQALDRREVSGFHRSVTEALSEWLCNNGFITEVAPLEDATIRARVISSMNDAVQSNSIKPEEIDELILEIVR